MCARRSQYPFAAPSTPLALLQLENDLLHADRASVFWLRTRFVLRTAGCPSSGGAHRVVLETQHPNGNVTTAGLIRWFKGRGRCNGQACHTAIGG
jgi:hypothetical protein